MSRAVIFVNGLVPDLEAARRLLRPGDTILAADGGTRHALALGLTPTAVIGDLDSLSVEDQQRIVELGTRLVEYPADKNETDLELALDYAIRQGFHEILVVGALGGRLDQTLGNLALLSAARLVDLDVRYDDGIEEVFFMRGRVKVHGETGDTVSLIPWGEPAIGVTTDGLRWPLSGERLHPEKTRGVSNQLLGESAQVSITSGCLLVVHRRKRKL